MKADHIRQPLTLIIADSSTSTTAISATTSSSYAGANSPILMVSAGANGTVGLSFPGSFLRQANGTSGAFGKWQWRVVGGTFADVSSEIPSGLNAVKGGFPEPENSAGAIEVSQQKTGLTAGILYEFVLLLRGTTAASLNWNGTASAVGS